MGKCAECSHYPWNPEVDPAQLNVYKKCHVDSGPRQWTVLSRDGENECKMFAPIEPVAADANEEKPADDVPPDAPIEPADVGDGVDMGPDDIAPVNETVDPIEPVAARRGRPPANKG